MILIGLVDQHFGHEPMSRNGRHGSQHPRVDHATRFDLFVDHGQTPSSVGFLTSSAARVLAPAPSASVRLFALAGHAPSSPIRLTLAARRSCRAFGPSVAGATWAVFGAATRHGGDRFGWGGVAGQVGRDDRWFKSCGDGHPRRPTTDRLCHRVRLSGLRCEPWPMIRLAASATPASCAGRFLRADDPCPRSRQCGR